MSISVSRTIVVRVHQELDALGCRQLDRILADLIDNRDATDLILDLSRVGHIDSRLFDSAAACHQCWRASDARMPAS